MNEEQSSDTPITLVMVHGVGDAKRGAVLADFCDALQKLKTDPAFREENLMIGRFPYARLVGDGVRFGGREIKEMIEVNWADVLRPGEGKIGILRHLVKLFFALRNLSLAPHANPSSVARFFVKVYWFLIERVLVWISLTTLGLMLLVSSATEGWKGVGVAVAVAAALVVIAQLGIWTKRPQYRSGFFWALSFLALGAAYAFNPDQAWRDGIISTSAKVYSSSHVVWSITLNAAFFWTVLAGGGSRSRRAARGGFLWLSFVLLSSSLVLLWLIVLASASRMPNYEVWTKSFERGFAFYELWISEVAMVTAQGIIFVGVPMIGLLLYRSSHLRRLLRLPELPGPAAHQMVEYFLIAGPVFLFLATIFILSTSIYPWLNLSKKPDLLEIYGWSAMRIPALLVFLLPGIRIIGDIVGDVLFHVQPQGSEVNSRKDTGDRLELLLAELAKRDTRYPVVILAHSQGSVISWGVLNRNPDLAELFVSVGSPLSTLYRRFLGGEFTDSYSLGLEWHNLYRDGDYVGGAVDGCPNNWPIGPGVHTDYWRDVIFARQFHDCLIRRDDGNRQ